MERKAKQEQEQKELIQRRSCQHSNYSYDDGAHSRNNSCNSNTTTLGTTMPLHCSNQDMKHKPIGQYLRLSVSLKKEPQAGAERQTAAGAEAAALAKTQTNEDKSRSTSPLGSIFACLFL